MHQPDPDLSDGYSLTQILKDVRALQSPTANTFYCHRCRELIQGKLITSTKAPAGEWLCEKCGAHLRWGKKSEAAGKK